jgi:Cu/Ag efflux protein CusF
MNEPLIHWIGALVLSVGLTFPLSGGLSDRSEAILPEGAICHAQLETDAQGVFHGVGIVKQIEAVSGALTLDHEDIVGLMPAMEMMYRVKTPEVSQGLKVGDRVEFEVEGKNYTILSVKVVSH